MNEEKLNKKSNAQIPLWDATTSECNATLFYTTILWNKNNNKCQKQTPIPVEFWESLRFVLWVILCLLYTNVYGVQLEMFFSPQTN